MRDPGGQTAERIETARKSSLSGWQHAARFLRTADAAAAVEFALVAPFFLLLVCIAFDLGLLLFTQTVLNNATRDAARIIMTNQTDGNASAFTAKLCGEMGGLASCPNLQYDVESAASFGALSGSVATDSNGNLQNNGTFSPGSPGQDVVVAVAYRRHNLLPWTMLYLDGSGGNTSATHVLLATVTFQNEP